MSVVSLARWSAVLLLTLALSGCVSDDAPADATDDDGTVSPAWQRAVWHFSDDWGLAEGEPLGETQRAALGDFYTKWAQGGPFPQWTSEPFAQPVLVNGTVRLEFFVTTDTVVTSTPGVFPDFVLYFGTTESVMADFSPRAIQPVADQSAADQNISIIKQGDAVRVLVEMTLPPGGITVPAGSGLRVITAPVMLETSANDLFVLYGSPQYPSHVSFDAKPLATDATAMIDDAETLGGPFQLVAGSIFHGQEIEDVTIKTLTFDVDTNDTLLHVDLRFTGTTPFPDMDLYVFAPDGTMVARSVTPGPQESIHLYRDNLAAVGPGTWSVKVVNYVTPGATFDLTVKIA